MECSEESCKTVIVYLEDYIIRAISTSYITEEEPEPVPEPEGSAGSSSRVRIWCEHACCNENIHCIFYHGPTGHPTIVRVLEIVRPANAIQTPALI